MSRVALVSSEPIRRRMGGIGVRYAEMASHLAARGARVTLISPAPDADLPSLASGGVEIVEHEASSLGSRLAAHDVVVAQGQLANDVVLAAGERPVAVDLYDPFLVENFQYLPTLGLDPYRNDHASWVLQLSRGDFFLCSSEEQRLFYLGFLAALGRVNPERVRGDEELRGLVDVVPFALPREIPPHRPYLPARPTGVRRLLFGALYDWYDPWTLLEAIAQPGAIPVELLVIRHTDSQGTPQRLFAELEARARDRGWWGERVRAIDWVPAERRFDLLRDVDALVAPHRPALETTLALRTRFLEALAVGCPVVATAGGALGRLLAEREAGWLAPPGDAAVLALRIAEALAESPDAAGRRARGRELAREFEAERALAPLVRFVERPQVDRNKERFAFRPGTRAPADSIWFRAARKLRRLRAAAGERSS